MRIVKQTSIQRNVQISNSILNSFFSYSTCKYSIKGGENGQQNSITQFLFRECMFFITIVLLLKNCQFVQSKLITCVILSNRVRKIKEYNVKYCFIRFLYEELARNFTELQVWNRAIV